MITTPSVYKMGRAVLRPVTAQWELLASPEVRWQARACRTV